MESFIVRLWTPADVDAPALRGTALHIASGEVMTFATPAELLEFLAHLGAPRLSAAHIASLFEP